MIKYLWFYICVVFVEKVLSQQLIKNVSGEAWDPAETIQTVQRIKSALIPSKSDLYNVLKYLFRCKRTTYFYLLRGLLPFRTIFVTISATTSFSKILTAPTQEHYF